MRKHEVDLGDWDLIGRGPERVTAAGTLYEGGGVPNARRIERSGRVSALPISVPVGGDERDDVLAGAVNRREGSVQFVAVALDRGESATLTIPRSPATADVAFEATAALGAGRFIVYGTTVAPPGGRVAGDLALLDIRCR